MTVELEAYLKEVDRRLLVCPKQRRLSLLKELRGNISAFWTSVRRPRPKRFGHALARRRKLQLAF